MLLRVPQNMLQSSLLFFFSLFLALFLDGLTKVFEVSSVCCSRRHAWPRLDIPANYCVYVLKLRVREHGMLCALEINSIGGSTRRHMEFCPLITTNITSPLPQCQWEDGDLRWWALTDKVTWPFFHVVLQDHVTN